MTRSLRVAAPEGERVARLRRGDGAAFDEAYAAHRPAVYRFLVRLSGSRPLAEELLQETFCRLAASAPSLRPDTRLQAWLFTVARNLWISHTRLRALDLDRVERAALRQAPQVPTPFEELAADETQRRLERALAAIPGTYREVLLLVVVEGLQPSEAAEVVGASAETVRQRLSRARAMLEEALVDEPRRAAGGRSR